MLELKKTPINAYQLHSINIYNLGFDFAPIMSSTGKCQLGNFVSCSSLTQRWNLRCVQKFVSLCSYFFIVGRNIFQQDKHDVDVKSFARLRSCDLNAMRSQLTYLVHRGVLVKAVDVTSDVVNHAHSIEMTKGTLTATKTASEQLDDALKREDSFYDTISSKNLT